MGEWLYENSEQVSFPRNSSYIQIPQLKLMTSSSKCLPFPVCEKIRFSENNDKRFGMRKAKKEQSSWRLLVCFFTIMSHCALYKRWWYAICLYIDMLIQLMWKHLDMLDFNGSKNSCTSYNIIETRNYWEMSLMTNVGQC